jgi:hypothetical protein
MKWIKTTKTSRRDRGPQCLGTAEVVKTGVMAGSHVKGLVIGPIIRMPDAPHGEPARGGLGILISVRLFLIFLGHGLIQK